MKREDGRHMSKLANFTRARGSTLAIAALRLMSLTGRFIITIYLARFCGVQAVGVYGYIVGGYTILSAVSGLGMNYTMDRDIIGQPIFIAALIVRDRMIVRSFFVIAIMTIVFALVPLPLELTSSPWPFLIVLGETMLFDIQRTIAFQGHQILANIFLYIRSAAWIPFVVLSGAFYPPLRTTNFVWQGWFFSIVLSIAILSVCCYKISAIRRGRALPVDWGWVRNSIKIGRLAYIADGGGVIVGYFDRYFIGSTLGLKEAGTFIFFWSFANAITSLVQASYFQVSFPRLVLFRKSGTYLQWRNIVVTGIRDVVIAASLMAIALLAGVQQLLSDFDLAPNSGGMFLFILMLVGTVIRLAADMLHDALHSARRDRTCLAIYAFAAVLSPVLTILCVSAWGLIGAGVEAILTGSAMLGLRLIAMRHVRRRRRPARSSSSKVQPVL